MDSLDNGLDRLTEVTFEWVPLLAGALLLVLLGFMVASAIKNALKRFLKEMQLDARMHSAMGGNYIERAVPRPTELLATVAYWVVVLAFLSFAASVLGIPALSAIVHGVYSFIPDLIAAILIFLAASALAGGAVTLVRNTMGDTPTGKLVESITPVIIVSVAIFMILDQLGIAPQIVTITYAALVGSVALGSALAFGLGGRDVAARMLEQGYQKAQTTKGQVKRDVAVGKARAQAKTRGGRR